MHAGSIPARASKIPRVLRIRNPMKFRSFAALFAAALALVSCANKEEAAPVAGTPCSAVAIRAHREPAQRGLEESAEAAAVGRKLREIGRAHV